MYMVLHPVCNRAAELDQEERHSKLKLRAPCRRLPRIVLSNIIGAFPQDIRVRTRTLIYADPIIHTTVRLT